MKKQIQALKNITMNISYSPFWVTKVSDEDHISVEVK